jgi:hypothetical protein
MRVCVYEYVYVHICIICACINVLRVCVN